MANVAGNYGTPTFINGSQVVNPNDGLLLGFLCTTSGTLDLYNGLGTVAPAVHIVQGLAVTAGQFIPMPLTYTSGLFAVCGGGAAGTIIWSS